MGITAWQLVHPQKGKRKEERQRLQISFPPSSSFVAQNSHGLLWAVSPLPITSQVESRQSQSWAEWDPAHLSRFLNLLHPSWPHLPELWNHRKSVEAFRLLFPGLWPSPASSVPYCASRGSSSLITSLLGGQVGLWCGSASVPRWPAWLSCSLAHALAVLEQQQAPEHSLLEFHVFFWCF